MRLPHKSLLVVFNAILIIHALTFADAGPVIKEEENVIVLTKDNFRQVVNTNEFVLVEFYIPYCHICKDFDPEYARAATHLKEEGSEIKLGKVDAKVYPELAYNFYVRSYPTLKLFNYGKAKDYAGEYDAAGIITYLKKKAGSGVERLISADEINDFQDSAEVVVIGYFKDYVKSIKYMELAKAINNIPFGVIDGAAAAKEANFTENTIAMFRKFDYGRTDYDGKLNVYEMKKWVQSNRLPHVPNPMNTIYVAIAIFAVINALAWLLYCCHKNGKINAHVLKEKEELTPDNGRIGRLGRFFRKGVTTTHDVQNQQILKEVDV